MVCSLCFYVYNLQSLFYCFWPFQFSCPIWNVKVFEESLIRRPLLPARKNFVRFYFCMYKFFKLIHAKIKNFFFSFALLEAKLVWLNWLTCKTLARCFLFLRLPTHNKLKWLSNAIARCQHLGVPTITRLYTCKGLARCLIITRLFLSYTKAWNRT